MSTVTTIQPGDIISSSRTTINTNFSNLNTDKIETSVLDTDTALTANSDAKVATQKAVKAYVDAGGNMNASTTNKGIVEEATAAEYSAQTATGATGARLFVNPSTGPTIETTAGTTHSLTTIAGQRVIVLASGNPAGAAGAITINLKYNGVTKHSISSGSDSGTGGFSLHYTETPGAATQNITVDTSAGSVANVVIIVIKF